MRRPLQLASFLVLTAAVTAQSYPLFPGERPVPLGGSFHDLDGDGVPDLVATLAADAANPLPGFSLSHGRGNGTFESPEVSPGSAGLISIGDVNGDGLPDVVAFDGKSEQAAPTARCFLNLGGGQFASPVPTVLTTIGSNLDVPPQLIDLDEDGRADLLTELYHPFQSQTVVARSLGDGSFAPDVVLPSGATESTGVVADCDLDGHLDLVGFNSFTSSLQPFLGSGPGLNFALGPVSPAPELGQLVSVSAFAAEDFDLDGRVDLVVMGFVSWIPLAARLLQEHGDAGATWSLATSQDVTHAGSIAVADLDGNLLPDVFIGGSATGGGPVPSDEASALLGRPGGGWEAEQLAPFTSGSPVQAVDLDVDGRTDVAIYGEALFGLGDGTFVSRLRVALGERPARVLATDLDGDGHADLVGTLDSKDAHTLATTLGDGAGGFAAPALLDLGIGALELAAADLDGDARPDLVLGAADPNLPGPLGLWINAGDGSSFSALATLASQVTAAIRVGDLDGDGTIDVVAADAKAKSLPVFLNGGAATFSAAPPADVGALPRDIALADVDADGALDVAVASYPAQAFYLLRGSGTGTFAPPQKFDLGTRPKQIEAADVDGDGLIDLIGPGFSFSGAHPLSLLTATAPAVFAPPTDLGESLIGAVPLEFGDVRVLDVDRDGHPDLVIRGSSAIQLARGLGGGEFAETRWFDIGTGAEDLCVLDSNEDGFADIAFPTQGTKSFELLPNITSPFPNLGYQLPAASGAPHLTTSGTPVPDGLVTFTAINAPAALGFLIVSLDFAPTPFHGGTLVPSPDVAVPIRPDVPLTGRWPVLPAGTSVFAQAWFAAGSEFAATNSVVAITQ